MIVKPAEVVIEEEVRDVSITADRFIDVEGGRTAGGAFYGIGACVGRFSHVVEVYIVVERELARSVLRSSPSILLHRPRQELLSSFPLLGFHGGRDDDKVSRCNAPAARGVVGEESPRAVLAQQLVVVRPDPDGREAVQGVVLHKGDVALVLQAEHRPSEAGVRILHCASNPWLVGATDLAELVRVVAQWIVSILQGIHCTRFSKEVAGRLDVVVAVGDGHDVLLDEVVEGDGPAGLGADPSKAGVLVPQVLEVAHIGEGTFLDHRHCVVEVPPSLVLLPGQKRVKFCLDLVIYVQEDPRHFLNPCPSHRNQSSLDKPEDRDEGMVAATDKDVTSVNDHHSGGIGHRRVHLVHAFFPEVDVVGFRNFISKETKHVLSDCRVVPQVQTRVDTGLII